MKKCKWERNPWRRVRDMRASYSDCELRYEPLSPLISLGGFQLSIPIQGFIQLTALRENKCKKNGGWFHFTCPNILKNCVIGTFCPIFLHVLNIDGSAITPRLQNSFRSKSPMRGLSSRPMKKSYGALPVWPPSARRAPVPRPTGRRKHE